MASKLSKKHEAPHCSYCGLNYTLSRTQYLGLKLKPCPRCKVVAYCSTRCQQIDWDCNHNFECKQMSFMVQNGIKVPLPFQAKKRSSVVMEDGHIAFEMCIFKNKLIIQEKKQQEGECLCVLAVYDIGTGKRDGLLRDVEERESVNSLANPCSGEQLPPAPLSTLHLNVDSRLGPMSEGVTMFGSAFRLNTITVNGEVMLLVACLTGFFYGEFELYASPEPGSKPIHKFQLHCGYMGHTAIGSALFVSTHHNGTLQHFDTSSIPFKATKTVRMDSAFPILPARMCAFEVNGTARLLINKIRHTTIGPTKKMDNWIMMCYDLNGELLWRMAPHTPDGKLITLISVCADKQGNIFLSDFDNNRLLVLRGESESMVNFAETLLVSTGNVGQVIWNEELHQLVMTSRDEDITKTSLTTYDTSARAHFALEDEVIRMSLDPKACCRFCGKNGDALSACVTCKVALYCGAECQVKDWEQKHSAECEELKNSNDSTGLEAIPCGTPWSFEETFVSKLCTFETKLVVMAWKTCLVSIHNMTTGAKERELCSLKEEDQVLGLHLIEIEGIQYVAVLLLRRCIQLWPFLGTQSDPVYSMPNLLDGSHAFTEKGTLLLEDRGAHVIREWDVKKIPFKETDTVIPLNLSGDDYVRQIDKMCAFQSNAGDSILLLCSTCTRKTAAFMEDAFSGKLLSKSWIDSNMEDLWDYMWDYVGRTSLRCLDYNGNLLWTLSKRTVDGKPMVLSDVCTDNNGHIFVTDMINTCILVVTCNNNIILTISTLIKFIGYAVMARVHYDKQNNQIVVLWQSKSSSRVARYSLVKCASSKGPVLPKRLHVRCADDVQTESGAEGETDDSILNWMRTMEGAATAEGVSSGKISTAIGNNAEASLVATICAPPICLENDVIDPMRICLDRKVLIVWGAYRDLIRSPVMVVSRKTGRDKRVLCPIEKDDMVNDISIVRITGRRYVLVSISGDSHCLQLWPWPEKASKPVYTYTVANNARSHLISCAVFHDDKILLYQGKKRTVTNIDISAIPFKSTGVAFKTHLDPLDIVTDMCPVVGKDGKSKLVILYRKILVHQPLLFPNLDEYKKVHSFLKCVNTRGRLLWQFEEFTVDGVTGQPSHLAPCCAHNVLVADRNNKRVLLVDWAGKAQTLITPDGSVAAMRWCAVKNQLFLLQDLLTKYQLVCYDVRESKDDVIVTKEHNEKDGSDSPETHSKRGTAAVL